jgi:hypothetical protein
MPRIPWSTKAMADRIGNERVRALATVERFTEHREEPDVVGGRQRMRHDDVRHELAGGVDVLAAVLVDVDHEMRGRQRTQHREVRILRAADFRHRASLARMDAESRARDDARPETQREQELGKAGDERRNAQRTFETPMRSARRLILHPTQTVASALC